MLKFQNAPHKSQHGNQWYEQTLVQIGTNTEITIVLAVINQEKRIISHFEITCCMYILKDACQSCNSNESHLHRWVFMNLNSSWFIIHHQVKIHLQVKKIVLRRAVVVLHLSSGVFGWNYNSGKAQWATLVFKHHCVDVSLGNTGNTMSCGKQICALVGSCSN